MLAPLCGLVDRIGKSGRVIMWTLVWYSFSAWSTFINKTLLGGAHIFPITLTFYHLFASVVLDGAVLLLPLGVSKLRPMTASDAFRTVAPVSFGMVFNKMFTYLSYGLVPVSLTHTVKASSPIFAVLISFLWMRRTFPRSVYLSLVPIVLGVSLASISEIEYNHTGFVCALLSALINVAQNMYAKQVLTGGPFDEWNLHFYVGAVAVGMLFPFVVALEAIAEEGRPPPPYGAIALCSGLQYVASIASYIVLSLIADITFTVANVLKRLFIIAASVIHFGQAVTLPNAAGIAIALSGAALYDVAKRGGGALQQRGRARRGDVEEAASASASASASTRKDGSALLLPSSSSSSSFFSLLRRGSQSPPTEHSRDRPPSPALLLRRAALWLQARASSLVATVTLRGPPSAGRWPGADGGARDPRHSAFRAVPSAAQHKRSRRALKVALGGAISPSDTFVGLTPTPSLGSFSRHSSAEGSPATPADAAVAGDSPARYAPLGAAAPTAAAQHQQQQQWRPAATLGSRAVPADARSVPPATPFAMQPPPPPTTTTITTTTAAGGGVGTAATGPAAYAAASGGPRRPPVSSVLPKLRHSAVRRVAPPAFPDHDSPVNRRLSSVIEEEEDHEAEKTPSPTVAEADAGAGGFAV